MCACASYLGPYLFFGSGVGRRLATSRHVEDLFDITSCYFPITFTPPPNDKFGKRPPPPPLPFPTTRTYAPRAHPMSH